MTAHRQIYGEFFAYMNHMMFHAATGRPLKIFIPQQAGHDRLPGRRKELAHVFRPSYTLAVMTGFGSIGEPIAAGIVVSLFNKYILNGRWRLQCCCVPEETPEMEEVGSNSSSGCPASEAGAINADLADCHVHGGAG